MRARTLIVATATAVLACAASVGPARADVQSDVTHDLTVSGVPGAQVTLSAPAGVETELRRADTAAPMLRVSYGPPDAPALGAIMPSPGTPALYNRNTGEELAWELAIVEALKHSLAKGSSLGGLALTTRRQDGNDETVTSALPIDPPETQAPPTLSPTAVKSNVQAALPQWAALSDVTVTDDAVGERIVQVALARPVVSFAVLDVPEVLQKLIDQQIALAPTGGNIGRVIVRVTDPATGDPLYVAAADALFGYISDWYSPLVRAWERPTATVGGGTADQVAGEPPATLP